jgi:hypothetical protein
MSVRYCESCDHADWQHSPSEDADADDVGRCMLDDGCTELVLDPTPIEPWEVTR